MALISASRNGIVLVRANVARSRPFLFRGNSMANPSTTEKRKVFRRLHGSGCFVIPNPWNVGSARYLQGLGFKALATTSSGFAHSQGYADEAQSCDQVLAHFRRDRCGHRRADQRRFRRRLCRRPRPSGRERDALRRDRRRRSVDRGFDRRSGPAALRFRRRAGAREGRARGDQQSRRRRGVHRPHRRLHPRPAGHGRDASAG